MKPSGLMHDFGGDGPGVHLAHANGFPPGAYQPLAEALSDHYHLVALHTRPLWPGSRPRSAPTWHTLADDLVEGLAGRGLQGIVGIGHSLGGILTMWAAIRRPALFDAIILIDPVLLPPSWLRYLWLLRKLGLEQRLPLVQGALRRRRSWPSQLACFEHYRGKSFFARWPDSSLRVYVEFGTRPRSDGQVELVYPPQWEAHIFATTPLDIWDDLPHLQTRSLVIRGELSETFTPTARTRMEHLLPQTQSVTIPGAGHLVPMERPVETAEAIRDRLQGR